MSNRIIESTAPKAVAEIVDFGVLTEYAKKLHNTRIIPQVIGSINMY